MAYRGGMRGLINAPDVNPKITWALLRRVLQYARPHSRFEVHPTLVPLLRSLERAA